MHQRHESEQRPKDMWSRSFESLFWGGGGGGEGGEGGEGGDAESKAQIGVWLHIKSFSILCL